MTSFLKNALTTFDNFGKSFNELNKTFDGLDFNKAFDDMIEQKDKLLERGKGWFGDFNDFIKEVKDTVKDVEIKVPYDKSKDTIEYSIDDNTITVKVKSNDGTYQNVVSTTIPDNADVNDMYNLYDDKKKVAIYRIPKKKKVISQDKLDKLTNSLKDKIDDSVDSLKDYYYKMINSLDEDDDTKAKLKDTADKAINEAVDEKVNKPKKAYLKQGRDKHGRFVAKIKN